MKTVDVKDIVWLLGRDDDCTVDALDQINHGLIGGIRFDFAKMLAGLEYLVQTTEKRTHHKSCWDPEGNLG